MVAHDTSKDGKFVRKDSAFRNIIGKESKFQAEADRYHLYVSYACPWAHRCLIVLALKGLENIIPVTVVHPTFQHTKPEIDGHTGWVFGNPEGKPITNSDGRGGPFPASFSDTFPDPISNSFSIREIYERAGDTLGKYTVPLLWDKKLNTIVNNESSEIIRMFNSEFNSFATRNKDLDLYPDDTKKKESIDSVNDWVYDTINNGVYKCGFATSQNAYNEAIKELTSSFDKVESILKKQRYLAGNFLSEADVRLFVTLLRFDEVYVTYFKTNTRTVRESPEILNYVREIYQMDGVAETCNMHHIKMHYFTSHTSLNRFSIIPEGKDFIALLKQPHDREILSSV
eukprot:CAMPEP_0184856374 /NCGR_PEP_ID=MMETSP0580-20130426/1561_1 /TAXON_ID=1118495 /ORGANISM="Dactyliosolen fragilissimus" /LENGTH=341 /DNA_ID=CAMNT_0027351373 /DNA_START=203 /DNA_END=1228 /DNA_ORIENTATION=-